MMGYILYPLAALGLLMALMPELFVHESMLGIDLGTTFSVACVCLAGNVSVVPVDGRQLTPSVVSYEAGGKTLIGRDAHHRRMSHPQDTIYDSKRLIGRMFDEGVVAVESEHMPFLLVNHSETGRTAIKPSQRDAVLPDDIATLILRKLKITAEREQGLFKRLMAFRFGTATVTVPVSFTKPQRRATEKAALAAGFKMVRLVDEPVAAALAYRLDSRGSSSVLVFDFGGGTLDVALLRLTPDTRGFLVRATAGDEHLGGEDFDRNVVNHLIQRLGQSSQTDVDSSLLQQLWRYAEKGKRTLQEMDIDTWQRTKTEVAFNTALPGGEKRNFVLTAAEFDQVNSDLYRRAMEPVQRVLVEVDATADEIDDVVLVGGSSRLFRVRQDIRTMFDNGHTSIHFEIDPDLAIAIDPAGNVKVDTAGPCWRSRFISIGIVFSDAACGSDDISKGTNSTPLDQGLQNRINDYRYPPNYYRTKR